MGSTSRFPVQTGSSMLRLWHRSTACCYGMPERQPQRWGTAYDICRPTATKAQLQEAYNREILTPFKSRVSETWGELLLDVEAAVTGHWADHHRWDRLSEGEWAELEAKCPFKLRRAAEKRR